MLTIPSERLLFPRCRPRLSPRARFLQLFRLGNDETARSESPPIWTERVRTNLRLLDRWSPTTSVPCSVRPSAWSLPRRLG